MIEISDIGWEELITICINKALHGDTKIEWLNIKKYYDFYLPNYNILIEYDGDYWHKNSLEECENDLQINNFKNDRLKDKIAQELGYKLIRITGNNKNTETILENIN